MSVIQNFLLATPEGYQISRSVRLRASASAYFNRTPASTTNRRTWTWSALVKRGSLGATGNLITAIGSSRVTYITFTSADKLTIYSATSAGGGDGGEYVSTQVFRDPSAWYHIVVAYDSTQATSTNRIKAFINGIQITSWSTSTAPTLNHDTQFNWTGAPMQLGAYNASQFFDGYITEVNFIDGQALTPSSFGEINPVTGVWQPKKYAGTYGTNGFYLNFSDNSAATAAAIGKDYSGNGNNWTPNNISVTAGVTYDSMLDVPTQWADGGNGRGNYAVLSPIDNNNGTLSNGNLNLSVPSGTSSTAFGNFAMTAGKWYWEIVGTNGSVFASMIGVADQSAAATNRSWATANGWYYYSNAQTYYNNTATSYGATFTTNDVIGIAYDADTGSLSFYKNGVSQGVAFSTNLLGKPIIPAFGNGTSSNAQTFVANFGQRPFAYTPPSGFKALNTLNLPTPTILKGEQYMNATLWNGNSTNATVITTTLGTVDFAWVKKRNGADDHRLANTVTGGNRHLKSNTTEAESTATTVIQAFSGSTFTLGTDNSVNATGGTYVGWTWQEGATQGFDIVTYTGNGGTQNISHNLGVAPRMMIVKSRSTAQRWTVFHTSISNAYIYLNETFAADTANAALRFGNNSAVVQPTSSVFTIGNSVDVNQNTTTYVAYLFAAVAGYSAFGSYTGNGSADGPFVFLGFRPRWILTKAASGATGSWWLYDTARSTYNEMTDLLRPDLSNADTTQGFCDALSNGFKIRNSGNNTNGATYIYMAFAENPFKNALAR